MERDLKERNLGVLEGITRKEALETHLYAFQAKESGEEIPVSAINVKPSYLLLFPLR